MTYPSPTPRTNLYTYATWLSKAMAGEHQCHYAGWFKSHFTFKAEKRDFNLDAWTAEHTAMVHDTAAELRGSGFKVYLEDQNTMRVRGQGGAVLVCKPDIVAVKGETAVIVDCKTGRPKTSDSLQVRLYMYLLSEWSTHPARGCNRILGEVRYQRDSDPVRLPHAAADGVSELVKRYMRVFLSASPPDPLPSARECRLCELGKFFCPDRIEEDAVAVDTDLF